LGSADRKAHAAKSTCVGWPAYLTTETVVPLLSPPQPEEAAPRPRVMATRRPTRSRRSALATIGALWKPARGVVSGLGRAVAEAFRWVRKWSSYVVQAIASGASAARRIGAVLRSSITQRAAARARKAAELAEKARVAEAERKERARAAHAARLEQARIAAAARAERERLGAERTERERAERERAQRERAERERAERERAQQERLATERAEQARRAAQETERARRSEPIAAAPITNNDTPLRQAPQPARPAAVEPARATTPRRQKAHSFADDGEDTTASDQPYRYLALARREGFQVSTNLERAGADGTETVWLLNEPESGIQITLVTSDVAVVEANLHYNIRIKDDAVLRATRPEHRDLDSRTIYVSESCAESLRARCRRLRATGALQRNWKVTPSIYPPNSAAQ
jgi:flagellar biosynthesis GTPase FlhF